MVYNDWWQPWNAEFEKFMLFRYFSIFGFMCVHSQPTKNMFVDTKYKNGKQILYKQTLLVTIRLADRLVNEFILIFFVIINKISKFTDVVSKFFNVSNLLQLSNSFIAYIKYCWFWM